MDALNKLKKKLKQWETSFIEQHRRKPSKTDIDGSPDDVKELYKQYTLLKKSSTQHGIDQFQAGVWGADLNKNALASDCNKDATASKTKPHELSAVSKLSQKLWERAASKESAVLKKSTPHGLNIGSARLGKLKENALDTTGKTRYTHGTLPKANQASTLAFQDNTKRPSCYHDNVDTEVVPGSAAHQKSSSSATSTSIFDKALQLVNRNRDNSGSADETASKVDNSVVRYTPKLNINRLKKYRSVLKNETGPETSISQANEQVPFASETEREELPSGTSFHQSCPNISPRLNNEIKSSVLHSLDRKTDGRSSKVGSGHSSATKFADKGEICRTEKNTTTNPKVCNVRKDALNDVEPTAEKTVFDFDFSEQHSPVVKRKSRVGRRTEHRNETEQGAPPTQSKKRKRSQEAMERQGDTEMYSQDQESGAKEVHTSQESDAASPTAKAARTKKTPAARRASSAMPPKKNLNENFVRLNLKKKRYSRGVKGMSGPAYKRLAWKQKMQARSESFGSNKCFKCGQEGHWANKCKGKRQSSAIGVETKEQKPVEDKDFPSMRQAVSVAQGRHAQEGHVDGEEDEDAIDDVELSVIRATYEPAPPPPPVDPLYQVNPDGSLPETPKEVYAALKVFGYDSFRPGQETAVMRILCGLSTLVVLSTGAGKSLCYQLPAYLYAKRRNSVALVISPLVSLMEDQVSDLPVGIQGACLHTNMSKPQREKVKAALSEGLLQFILLSPEALVGSGFGEFLSGAHKMPPISFACIDEAHCVSEWSHHFRPSYLRVCKVLKEQLGVKSMLGLTATATLVTAASVSRHLRIEDYEQATIRGCPVPDNLNLSVSFDEYKDEALISLLKGSRFSQCRSIIIYCTRREETNRLATLIRTCLKDQIPAVDFGEKPAEDEKPKKGRKKAKTKGKQYREWDAECYHAGLTPAQRKRVQKAFMSGELRVVVATVAFGMGLDKADVRGVIHFNLPKSFESYVQEIGRAGRDGLPADCHVFLDPTCKDMNELKRHIHANTVDRYTVKKLLRKVFPECRCKEIHQRHLKATKECEFEDDGIDYSQLDLEVDGSVAETTGGSTNQLTTEAPAKPYSRLCPQHERAVPIEKTVMDLDMKEEGIETLLCYLELHPKKWIQILSLVYATCRIQCYGGPLQLLHVSKKCPPVAVAIAKSRKKGSSFSHRNDVEMSVVEISDSMGWDSGAVKRELSRLQWDLTNPQGPRKSGVVVEFSDLAFHLRSPGDLTDPEMDEVLDFLMERINTQEKVELFQLQNFYNTLKSVAHKYHYLCSEEVDLRRSEKLKASIRQYFDEQPHFEAGQVSMLSFARELEFKNKSSEIDEEVTCDNEHEVKADIHSFINLYGQEHSLSGRAIARIFHGIGSPCFPVEVWCRVRRFWRSHLDVDFNLLRKLATQVLLRMK